MNRSREWDDLTARLENYKEQQTERAKNKGPEVYKKFIAAKTLTQARKILRGETV